MTPEDRIYQQFMMKKIMEDKNPMNKFSQSQAEIDNINPERSYVSPTLNRVVAPYEEVGDEVSAKKELDKFSNQFFGSDFENSPESDKLRLLMELDKNKKDVGLKGGDLWL